MATPTDVIGQLFGGVAGQGVNFVVWIIIICAMGGILLYSYWWRSRRPFKYPATIFEQVGDAFRVSSGKVLYKRFGEERGYYVAGYENKIHLNKKLAVVGSKGHTAFYLLKVGEDKFIPMQIDKLTKVLMDGETKKIEVKKFVAETKIDEYERALEESYKRDAQRYRWIDKYGQLLTFGGMMIMLLIAFFLTAWSTKGQGEITAELQELNAEHDKTMVEWQRTNDNFEALIQALGGTVVPPPG